MKRALAKNGIKVVHGNIRRTDLRKAIKVIQSTIINAASGDKDVYKYIPSAGPAETLHGEILRAVTKIEYRYYNDGDYFYEDYGCETAGPAAKFLEHVSRSEKLPSYLKTAINELLKNTYDSEYEKLVLKLKDATWKFIDEIEDGKIESVKNTDDMLKYDDWCDSSEDDYGWDEDEEEDD